MQPAIDTVFQAAVEATQAWAASEKEARLGLAQRIWAGDAAYLDVDPADVAAMGESFDRTAVDEMTTTVMRTAYGTLGQVMSLRIQGDYLATRERAARLAGASRVRRALWPAARLSGHAVSGVGAPALASMMAQDFMAVGTAIESDVTLANPDNAPSTSDIAAIVASVSASLTAESAAFEAALPQDDDITMAPTPVDKAVFLADAAFVGGTTTEAGSITLSGG